jgi:outer membrane protein TolC
MSRLYRNTSSWLIAYVAISMSAFASEETGEQRAELSIEAAVMHSLQNNRGLRVQQYGPIIAGAFREIERGVYDPELYANVRFSEETATETARSTGQQFSVEGTDADGAIGVRQRLPTGTEIDLSVRSDRSSSNRAPEQQQARLGLTLTQQLLRGMGPAVNLAGIRQARFEESASVYELRGYTESLVADVEIAYWEYAASIEAIRVYESSLSVAEQQLEAVLARIEFGDLPKQESAAARAEVAQRKQDLIDAKSAQKRARYSFHRLVYPRLPAMDSSGPVLVSFNDERLYLELDTINRMELALQSRPEIKEAESLLARDALQTVVTRNGRLPRLELFINIGKSGYADTFRGSFRDSEGPSYDASVGLELTQALGNRAERARDLVAKSTFEQSQIALENLKDSVRYDVVLAVNELERSYSQIEASAETVRYRELALEGFEDRFELGAATTLTVARAQRDLIAAQISQINARLDYLIAQVELLRSEGSLLDRRGIVSGEL